MSGPLEKGLRNQLGTTITKARQAAESGAKNALEMLAVDRHEPHASMSTDERSLRNRLRARGRQLGDVRDKVRGIQSIDRLVHEVAYEYWHRMLFSRFLTENHLLIEPNSGVAISMEECEELSREAGEDPRLMAARFAQDSLPQIFRSGDPVLEVTLAPETRQALDKLLDGLPAAIFTADDSLGWTYQYWQAEKKDAVNASGNKIGADELPAVTQLFTEHYMVLFLYHNTIGAWHAGRVLAENPGLAETAQNEDELRQAVRLHSSGGYDFKYLRFVREMVDGDDADSPTGPWRPAAGTFEGWPKAALELKVLDPCCGSGHFLTEGFELLVRLRMDEEGLDLENAIHGVLSNNLHGLELDPRCTQIAAFNLAVAAWKLASKPIELPTLRIACSGLAVGSSKGEWAHLAGDNERLRNGMEKLYALFEQAPELGSLIDPKALKGDLLIADITELQPLLEQALEREASDSEVVERVVTAHGMAHAADLLLNDYVLAITNVPYLGRWQQSQLLREFADKHYKEAKTNLATMFIQRILHLLAQEGTLAVVTQQDSLFKSRYEKLRRILLDQQDWNIVGRLGPGAFETISGEVVDVALLVMSNFRADSDSLLAGIDASSESGAFEIACRLRSVPPRVVFQLSMLENPAAVVSFEALSIHSLLGNYVESIQGLATSDNPQFVLYFWELASRSAAWEWIQSAPDRAAPYRGLEQVLFWGGGSGRYYRHAMALKQEGRLGGWKSGKDAWGKTGLSVSEMGTLPHTNYIGSMYDHTAHSLIPKNHNHLPALWCFFEQRGFHSELSKHFKGHKHTNHTFLKVPFDLDHWQRIAEEMFPDGLPKPQSNDPTQWLFHGHPTNAEPSTVLQVAIGRLLGFRWPPELDPEVTLADEARAWLNRTDELEALTDEDGIICLSPTRGERSASERIRELLSASFGPSWSVTKERELLVAAGDGQQPSASLEVWLRDKFFEEHCKLFHNRPFVWHIWDGNKDGFHCLVNAHKLTGTNGEGRRTLEAITYSYLGDWIDRQRADQAEGKEGADSRLAAAQDLQGQLAKILEGEPPYDLFVRWKPLHEQPIGWDPDIYDGIRLNIRPFMNAGLRKGGKKGAGILRWKPNIKWKKDRGKEPQSLRPIADFPWFWGCEDGADDFSGRADFDGNRWNDLHYSIAFKQEARERAAERKNNAEHRAG